MKSNLKRATIYFEPDLHQAVRVKAAEVDRSISELVNEALRLKLSEDAEDLASFEKRASEINLAFEDVLKKLKKRGKL